MPLTLAELNTDLADPEVIGNYIEAGFWMAVGLILGVTALVVRPPYRRLSLLAAVFLVLFGLSDVVEAQTGAWWRPFWLLLWKGACILVLAWCYWHYRTLRKRLLQTAVPVQPPGTR
jgi:hypothetical protein